eukprot:gene11822-24787_t
MASIPKFHENRFLLPNIPKDTLHTTYILVLLNSDAMTIDYVKRLWDVSSIRICADGGANRLFDGCVTDADKTKFIPHYICGDLDSLRPDVANHYRSCGVSIERDINQDDNDLEKCLSLVKNQIEMGLVPVDCTGGRKTEGYEVLLLGAFGGRFDQEMASVHVAYKWKNIFGRIILLGGNNVANVLTAGRHFILP